MEMNMVDAINSALRKLLETDDRVVILGEDVGKDGGVFRVTEGLQKDFKDKVIDTPLAESGIVGVAIGMAAYGMRPIAEIQFSGFMPPTFDQLMNHAGRIRNRTRGRYTCPIVVRAPHYGGIHAPEHHSEGMESMFIHTPGIKVVVPSTPYDAKGLLISCLKQNDPVIFLEPIKLYRSAKQDVPEESYEIPLGKASIVKEGNDITLISWGSMMRVCREAIKDCPYSVELIDLRTLMPFDKEAILQSIEKTGRCVIVQESPKTLGFAAELISVIEESELLSLKAPVARVTGYDIVVPLFKNEDRYIPSKEKVLDSIEKTMKF